MKEIDMNKLKGEFAKNERGCRFTTKNNRFDRYYNLTSIVTMCDFVDLLRTAIQGFFLDR